MSEVSGASERANGQASGPVLQSVFLVVLAQSAKESRRRPRLQEICACHSREISLFNDFIWMVAK